MAVKNGGPSIPNLPEELALPVTCLARAATTFHKILEAVRDGHDIDDLVEEHHAVLRESESVLGLWRDHLGLDVEDLLDD